MLADKSVRSNNIGTGSVMLDHFNSEVKAVLKVYKSKLMSSKAAHLVNER